MVRSNSSPMTVSGPKVTSRSWVSGAAARLVRSARRPPASPSACGLRPVPPSARAHPHEGSSSAFLEEARLTSRQKFVLAGDTDNRSSHRTNLLNRGRSKLSGVRRDARSARRRVAGAGPSTGLVGDVGAAPLPGWYVDSSDQGMPRRRDCSRWIGRLRGQTCLLRVTTAVTLTTESLVAPSQRRAGIRCRASSPSRCWM